MAYTLDDVQRFWTQDSPRLCKLRHQRGSAGWASTGTEARMHVLDLLKHEGRDLPLSTVVEWGVGGGSVAAALAGDAMSYVGVDVSEDALCEAETAVHGLKTILIDVDAPEVAEKYVGSADLFVSSWCYPHFPGELYAQRITDIAGRITGADGLALLHVALSDSPQPDCNGRSYADVFERSCVLTTQGAMTMARRSGFRVRRIRRDLATGTAWLYLGKG